MIKEKLIKAATRNEWDLFLRGDGFYKIETSQYAPGIQPTDVGKVLSKAIYKAYEDNPLVKEQFEETLIIMLDGTVLDIYVVVLYIVSQLFKEKNELSPFKLDLEKILPKLSKQLEDKRAEIQKGVRYPDGFEKKEAWSEIERFNKICKEEYQVSLLS